MTLNNQDPNCEQDTPAVSRRRCFWAPASRWPQATRAWRLAMPGHDHSKHAPQHPDLLTAVEIAWRKASVVSPTAW